MGYCGERGYELRLITTFYGFQFVWFDTSVCDEWSELVL